MSYLIRIIKRLASWYYTRKCLKNISHGKGCICNHKCIFSSGTIIGDNCHFNGAYISGSGIVKIGSNFHSGEKLRILTTFHDYDNGEAVPYGKSSYSKDIMIGNNVWVGENVLILGGTKIGEGAVIQAGSVVCIDVPDMAVAGGHPAIPFKYRDKEHYTRLVEEGMFF